MSAPAAATPRTVTITLPLPPRQVTPNARVHWRTKARAVANYRVAARYAATAARRAAGDPRFAHARVAVRYVICGANPLGNAGRAQPHDLDNCLSCAKSALDGVIDAGLLPDDSAERLHIGDLAIERHRKGRCPVTPCPGSRVEMTFVEVL